MHTIKPLDTEAILKAGRECQSAVITVEEHMVNGGLGEAVRVRTLLQAGVCKPFRIVGIPDEETVPGAQADIFRHYGISMEGLSETAAQLSEEVMSHDPRPRPIHVRDEGRAVRRRAARCWTKLRAATGRFIRSQAGWNMTLRRFGRTSSRSSARLPSATAPS
jgi:hypothetical protein